MSKKGILAATAIIILSALSAHYFDIVVLPVFPSNFKSDLFKPTPDFEISANPNPITLNSGTGSSNTTIIILESENNLKNNITLIVSSIKANFYGIMDNVKIALNPNHIFLPANGREQSTLTIEVKSHITPGAYNIDVIGVAGEIKHTLRIHLMVTN